MNLGILALQGAFLEHKRVFDSLGVNTFYIKTACDIQKNFDGLVLPGGESTVMVKLLKELNLYAPLQDKIVDGLPVFGTCAGLILLSKQVENEPIGYGFQTMDITVKRNGYGRQLESFVKKIEFNRKFCVDAIFIRAPLIVGCEKNVSVLADIDGRAVAVKQGNQLACTFHPELSPSTRIHKYFLDMIG